MKPVRVGLVGCGTVGRGLLDMLATADTPIRERYGVRFRVTRMAVRDIAKDRGPLAAGIPRTTNALAVVSDPDVDVMVEVAGARYTSVHAGQTIYFCCAGCKRSFDKEPEKYLTSDGS